MAHEDLPPTLDEFQTPWDAAAALVFHDPEIMNLDLEQGPAIRDLIQTLPCPADDPDCLPYLSTLAFRIAQHWPATESGITIVNNQQVPAWAQLVPLLDPETRNPLLDTLGQPVYRIDLANETVAAAQQTIRAGLKPILDDSRSEGNNWHDVLGRTATTFSFGSGEPAQTAGFDVVADFPPGTSAHGLDFVSVRVADQVKRMVELQLRNWHLRTHAVHVEFANEAGTLPVQNREDADPERSK